MKKALLASLTGCLSFMFVAPTLANISLTLPKSAELLVVNGEKSSSKSKINLDNGSNQIVFKYNTTYRDQGQVNRFNSAAIILTFTAKDTDYHLSLPTLKSNSQAKHFNRSPNVTIEDKQGNKLNSLVDTLYKEGIQLGRNYDAEILAYNKTDAIAALKTLAPTSVVTSIPVNSTQAEKETILQTTPALKNQKNISEMLDFWYSQADEETQKAFKLKINLSK